jgi:hypothetical protein
MSAVSDKLLKIDTDLKVNQLYVPEKDKGGAGVVIVVGKDDISRFTLDLERAHRFSKIVVYPRRFEHSVAVYLLVDLAVGNSKVTMSSLLYWPYHWEGKGRGLALVFPAAERILSVPVRRIPDDLSLPPVKIGPLKELQYRDILLHLQELRMGAYKKYRRPRSPRIASFPFPHRNRTNPETIYWNNFQGGDDYYTAWQESPVNTMRYYRAFSSVNTPGFRGKRRGRLPVNPYSLTRIMAEDPMGHDIRNNAAVAPWGPMKSSRYYQPSSLWIVVPAPPVHDEQNYNRALARCIKRAEIGLDGNIAQDVAQMGQITNMVGDSVHRIAAAIHNVKRKNYKDALESLLTPTTKSRGIGYRVSGEGKGHKSNTSVLPVDFRTDMRKRVDVDLGRVVSPTKSVAENWLALQYGWKPLLADIHGALEAFARYCVQDPEVVRGVKGSAKSVSKSVTELGTTSYYYQKTGESRVATYSNCKIGLRYTIDSGLRAFAAQTGFTNPINLAWEVLPYSFVVDWFLPIGPYLETLSAFDGLAFLDGYVTNATVQYTLASHDFYGRFPANETPIYTMWDKRARYWRQYIQINRQRITSFPGAVMPSFKNPLSITHAMNGLSLLRAAFR